MTESGPWPTKLDGTRRQPCGTIHAWQNHDDDDDDGGDIKVFSMALCRFRRLQIEGGCHRPAGGRHQPRRLVLIDHPEEEVRRCGPLPSLGSHPARPASAEWYAVATE